MAVRGLKLFGRCPVPSTFIHDGLDLRVPVDNRQMVLGRDAGRILNILRPQAIFVRVGEQVAELVRLSEFGIGTCRQLGCVGPGEDQRTRLDQALRIHARNPLHLAAGAIRVDVADIPATNQLLGPPQ